MLLAQVLGSVVSTIKHASMRGQRLLLLQPLMADRATADGDPLVAVDATGAGPGQHVIITSDGAATRAYLSTEATPVRWMIIGIQDRFDEQADR